MTVTVLAPTRTSVGDLAVCTVVLDGGRPALEAERLLREHAELPALVVRDRTALGLLTRPRLERLLTGSYGHGRALLERRTAAGLLPADTLVLPAETPVAVAGRAALRRPAEQQHDDLVVTFDDAGLETVGLVPAAAVFALLLQEVCTPRTELSRPRP